MPSFTNMFNTSFPTIPSSLSAGGHGMRDNHAEQDYTMQRFTAHSLQGITPYLGLRSRLSQVWINRWTILILLVLARVLIAIVGLNHDLDSAKIQALSACTSVESMGSAMASMPHYMSQGTNELAARGVEKAVSGLESMLFMAVTAFEEVFVFVVNMVIGTYQCLITLAVGTAAEGAIAVAEDVTRWLNETVQDITGEITSGMDSFEGGLNDFLGTFNNLFNGGRDPPQINLDGPIGKLKDLRIPSDVQQKFDELKESIPNYDEVRNKTEQILRLPFEAIKDEMREHLGNFTFDRDAFPVPSRRSVSFCSDDDGINSFFDDLYDIARITRKVCLAVLVIASVLVCIPVAWMEIRRWRSMRERARLVEQKSLDPMDVIYIASRPYTAASGIRISQNFSSTKKQVLTRWFVAYCTSTPALVVLSLALAGLFACLCQYILLKAIHKEVPTLANHIGGFADRIVTVLDEASLEWSNGTNSVIVDTNTDINERVFGWVNSSTSAVNETLNTFIDETTTLLNSTFGGTPIYRPIQGVFDCLVGLKVEALQRGLTWAKDHAHIDFPLFPNDTFATGVSRALASSDNGEPGTATDSPLSSPGSTASDKITEVILKLIDKLAEGIRTEALISTAILCIYIFICLCALIRALFLLSRRDVARAEGGVSYAGDINSGNSVGQPIGTAAPMFTQQPHRADQIPAPAYQERDRFTMFKEPMPSSHNNTSVSVSSCVGSRGVEEYRKSQNNLDMYGVVENEKQGTYI